MKSSLNSNRAPNSWIQDISGFRLNISQMFYPRVILHAVAVAIQNGPVEKVGFPIENGGSFHGYENVYQRVQY